MGFFSQLFGRKKDSKLETAVAEEPEAPTFEEHPVLHIQDLPENSNPELDDSMWPPEPRFSLSYSVREVFEQQGPLIRRICKAVPLSDDLLEAHLLPTIWNVANFVHLVSASESHHHSGYGGLFRHLLECALYAANSSRQKIFDNDALPMARYSNRGKWILACVLAALLHDVGKVVTDVTVRTKSGDVWNPSEAPLGTWLARRGFPPYAFFWNKDREFSNHPAASLEYARKLVPDATFAFLTSDCRDIEAELREAIVGSTSKKTGRLAAIVLNADMESVRRDTEAQQTIDKRDKLVSSTPTGRIIEAVAVLIADGKWSVNTSEGPVFVTNKGVFIRWDRAGDINAQLAGNGYGGVPQDKGMMAWMLADAGLIERTPESIDTTDRLYWSMCPLPAKDVFYSCVKLTTPEYVFIGATPAPVHALVKRCPVETDDETAWMRTWNFVPATGVQNEEQEAYLSSLLADSESNGSYGENGENDDSTAGYELTPEGPIYYEPDFLPTWEFEENTDGAPRETAAPGTMYDSEITSTSVANTENIGNVSPAPSQSEMNGVFTTSTSIPSNTNDPGPVSMSAAAPVPDLAPAPSSSCPRSIASSALEGVADTECGAGSVAHAATAATDPTDPSGYVDIEAFLPGRTSKFATNTGEAKGKDVPKTAQNSPSRYPSEGAASQERTPSPEELPELTGGTCGEAEQTNAPGAVVRHVHPVRPDEAPCSHETRGADGSRAAGAAIAPNGMMRQEVTHAVSLELDAPAKPEDNRNSHEAASSPVKLVDAGAGGSSPMPDRPSSPVRNKRGRGKAVEDEALLQALLPHKTHRADPTREHPEHREFHEAHEADLISEPDFMAFIPRGSNSTGAKGSTSGKDSKGSQSAKGIKGSTGSKGLGSKRTSGAIKHEVSAATIDTKNGPQATRFAAPSVSSSDMEPDQETDAVARTSPGALGTEASSASHEPKVKSHGASRTESIPHMRDWTDGGTLVGSNPSETGESTFGDVGKVADVPTRGGKNAGSIRPTHLGVPTLPLPSSSVESTSSGLHIESRSESAGGEGGATPSFPISTEHEEAEDGDERDDDYVPGRSVHGKRDVYAYLRAALDDLKRQMQLGVGPLLSGGIVQGEYGAVTTRTDAFESVLVRLGLSRRDVTAELFGYQPYPRLSVNWKTRTFSLRTLPEQTGTDEK